MASTWVAIQLFENMLLFFKIIYANETMRPLKHRMKQHQFLMTAAHECFLYLYCVLSPAQTHRNQFYWQNGFILFIHYLHLYLLIFWMWNHYFFNQNMIMMPLEHWKIFIRLNGSGKLNLCNLYQTWSGIMSLTCDLMETMDRLSSLTFNCIHNES